ncbi:MAG: hypothetical protein AAGG80_01380 [Pseudomonadota bacterium]
MTDMSDMFNKFKSMIDQFTGPGHSEKTEAALAEEKDEFKAKLLQIELFINQLHDTQVMQAKMLSDLQKSFAALKTELIKNQQTEQEKPQSDATDNNNE